MMDEDNCLIYSNDCNGYMLPAKRKEKKKSYFKCNPINKSLSKSKQKKIAKKIHYNVLNDVLYKLKINDISTDQDNLINEYMSYLTSKSALKGNSAKYIKVYDAAIKLNKNIENISSIKDKVEQIKKKFRSIDEDFDKCDYTLNDNIKTDDNELNNSNIIEMSSQNLYNMPHLSVNSSPNIVEHYENMNATTVIDDDVSNEYEMEIMHEWIHKLNKTSDIIRTDEIEKHRINLPIITHEEEIVSSIIQNDITLLCGGTGCGKSTQVPQFLLEAGFCFKMLKDKRQISLKLGLTQPRKLATLSLYNRLKIELSNYNKSVSYHIKNDYCKAEGEELIEIMTEGILCKYIQSDTILKKYSIIILDEVHERSMNCDILLTLLLKIIKIRKSLYQSKKTDIPPLKLLLMSATMNNDEFMNKLNTISQNSLKMNLINIPNQMYAVTIHYNKNAVKDYIDEAANKVAKIHNQLPSGSVLVFLPGKKEIRDCLKLIEKKMKNCNIYGHVVSHCNNFDNNYFNNESEYSDSINVSELNDELQIGISNNHINISMDSTDNTSNSNTLFDAQSEDEEAICNSTQPIWEGSGLGEGKVIIFTVYSGMPNEIYEALFISPTQNERFVFLSTNVSETSITLPNIRYVIDCGYKKEFKYADNSLYSSYSLRLITKSNAIQRTGRAGRTGPGHCYRLYTASIYEFDMENYPQPEILRQPIASLLLYLCSIGIVDFNKFKFIEPIPEKKIQTAINQLYEYEYVTINQNEQLICNITAKGRHAILFPMSPRFSSTLLLLLNIFLKNMRLDIIIIGFMLVCAMQYGSDFYEMNTKQSINNTTLIDDLDFLYIIIVSFISNPNAENFKEICNKYHVYSSKLNSILIDSHQLLNIAYHSIIKNQSCNTIDNSIINTMKEIVYIKNIKLNSVILQKYGSVVGKNENVKDIIKTCFILSNINSMAIACNLAPHYLNNTLMNSELKAQIDKNSICSKSLIKFPLISYFEITKKDKKYFLSNIISIEEPHLISEIINKQKKKSQMLNLYLDSIQYC